MWNILFWKIFIYKMLNKICVHRYLEKVVKNFLRIFMENFKKLCENFSEVLWKF